MKERLTTTVDPYVMSGINQLSKETLIPKSTLVNKILSDYLKVHRTTEKEN